MADITNLSQFLGDIADAIRTKKDTSASIPAAEFDAEILSIETGTNTNDADAVAENIEAGKTAYVKGEKVTGTLDNAGGSADVMVQSDNITVGNERGWDCVSTKYTNSGKKIYKDGWYVNQHIKFEDLAPKLGVTPEKIIEGEIILGIEGTATGGGGTGEGTEDATATEDDVLSPRTFYAGGKKRVGAIETTNKTISGGMRCETNNQVNSYWVADVCDKYNIAVVYVYNQQNPWYIYEWTGDNLGRALLSLSSGVYPGGALTKSVSIAKELNELGYLNIWCHAVNSTGWSDEMRGFLGVLQYDIKTNTVIKSKTVNTQKPGGYVLNGWNENGNMASCLADPNKCFTAYYNKDRTYMDMLVYNPATNVITRYSKNTTSTSNTYHSCEWSEDGKYVLVTVGSKSHPVRHIVLKVNDNNTLTLLNNSTSTYIPAIYSHYLIRGNKIYDISSGTLTLVKTWSAYPNYTSSQAVIWTYGQYLFVASYTKLSFTCYKITDDLDLNILFNRQGAPYVSNSSVYYAGTLLVPASNSTLYFSPDLNTMYKMTMRDMTSKVTSLMIQGELFANTNEVTATQANVLTGKQFFTKDGFVAGTMPNNGTLNYEPSINEQTIPYGFTSGGTIGAVDATIDRNIAPENIKKGVTILGVDGTLEKTEGGSATSDGNLQAKYLLEGYSAVVDDTVIEGAMQNYGSTTMNWTSEVQEIPTGYYDELYIPKAVASDLSGYDDCDLALDAVLYGDKT